MNSRNLLWQIPALMLLLFPLWYGSLSKFLQVDKITSSQAVEADSSFVMEGVILSQAKKGDEEIRLNADRMFSKDDQSVIFLEKTDTTLLGSKKKDIDVRGDEAVYETEKQILTMIGDVEVVTDNTVVLSPVMRYLSKFKKIKSAGEVEMLSDGMRITGTSFMYDLNSGDLRVGRRVYCSFW